MFGWVSKAVTAVASEVQQFGHDCVESIVGEEEEAVATPQREDAQRSSVAEAAPQQTEVPPVTGSPQRPEGEGDWVPTELRFVEKQTVQLASFGWGLVEKGAGIAMSLLGEDEAAEKDTTLAEVARHAKEVEPVAIAETAVAPTEEHPLVRLRACRGYLGMLRRQAGKSDADDGVAKKLARTLIVPRAVTELDFSEDLDVGTNWVAVTMIGRRIVTTRKMLTNPLDEEGEPLKEMEVVAALPEFKRMSVEACEAVARMVIEELAELLARPSRDASTTLAQTMLSHRKDTADEEDDVRDLWFLHRRQHSAAVSMSLTEHVAQNIVDLVNFAFCEMHKAAADLCSLAQECATWARKTDHPDAKSIKELSMTVRGECLSSNVDALVALEEALEIVLAVFPDEEGTLPLEPLKMGAPIEYVRDDTVVIETEQGEIAVQSLDRHERPHHDEEAHTTAEHTKEE